MRDCGAWAGLKRLRVTTELKNVNPQPWPLKVGDNNRSDQYRGEALDSSDNEHQGLFVDGLTRPRGKAPAGLLLERRPTMDKWYRWYVSRPSRARDGSCSPLGKAAKQ